MHDRISLNWIRIIRVTNKQVTEKNTVVNDRTCTSKDEGKLGPDMHTKYERFMELPCSIRTLIGAVTNTKKSCFGLLYADIYK